METNLITITIDHESLTAATEHPLVSGSIGVVDFTATFDPSWEGYEKKLVFTAYTRRGTVAKEVIGTSGQVPWEVLTDPGALYISAVGVAEGMQQPTAAMREGLRVHTGGALGGQPGAPTPDFQNQVLAQLQILHQGEPGQVLGTTEAGSQWVDLFGEDMDLLRDLAALGMVPAATSDGAVLTDGSRNILLW